MYCVGFYLDRGVIGELWFEEVFVWYVKVVEWGDGDVIFVFGCCYKNGIGMEENLDKVFEWFIKGVENNEFCCFIEMGLVYEYGSGIEENFY